MHSTPLVELDPLVAAALDDPRGTEPLAIDGGAAVRASRLNYGRASIDDSDVAAVARVLRSEWLTTGPEVERFEESLSAATGAREAIVVSSGTAALHAALHVLDLQPGDEVLVPAITFAATANAVRYVGARPVFVDVDPTTLLLDPASVAERITPRTRAIVAVDYAGQACDYAALDGLTRRHHLTLVADASHALGGAWRGRPIGSLAALTTFSFHPLKGITSGEGGAITTDDAPRAARLRAFRNHGIDPQHRQSDTFVYDQSELGYNYRLSDLACALGRSQLARLPWFIERRRHWAQQYRTALARIEGVSPLAVSAEVEHAWHLFVVRLPSAAWRVDRATLFQALRAEGIGVQVHYRPVYLHLDYQRQGERRGSCPRAEQAADEILSLPLFVDMAASDVADVIVALRKLRHRWGA